MAVGAAAGAGEGGWVWALAAKLTCLIPSTRYGEVLVVFPSLALQMCHRGLFISAE